MSSNSSEDENTSFTESLRSFRNQLSIENSDTKAILDYFEHGLNFLNNKIELNSKTYDDKINLLIHNYKNLDKKINSTNDDLKKALKDTNNQIEKAETKMTGLFLNKVHTLEEEILQTNHKYSRMKKTPKKDFDLFFRFSRILEHFLYSEYCKPSESLYF